MQDLKILLYLDVLKIKNKLIDILNHPFVFLKKILIFVLCFGFLGFSFFSDSSKAVKFITPEFSKLALGAICIFSILIILGVISYYFNEYSPKNFSLSDIQYLFPSPINNNVILTYSMIKSALKGIFSCFLGLLYFIILILAKTNLSIKALIPLSIGCFFIFMYFISLSYLIFAIRLKFSLNKAFKFIYRLVLILILGVIAFLGFKLYSFDFSTSELLNYVVDSKITKIPLIYSIMNFASVLLNDAIFPSIFSVISLVMLTLFNCILFNILNVDYYESIAEKVAEFDQKMKTIRANKTNGNALAESSLKKVNLKSSTKDRYGVMALYWKGCLLRKRKETSTKKLFIVILTLAVSIGGGIASIKGFKIQAISAITAVLIYGSFILVSYSELSRELQNVHIFLIPGKPIFKILATILDEFIIYSIKVSIMMLPAILLGQGNYIFGVGLLFLTLVYCLVAKLQNLITVLLSPKDENAGPGILSMIYSMAVIMIPCAVAGALAALTKSFIWPFLGVALIGFIYLTVLGLLCNMLFNKIEY